MNSSNNQSQIVETFIKKLLAHLDECEVEKLQQFLQLFKQQDCKIIVNAQPFAQPTTFLQIWQQQVVATQHSLTSLDYHVIPGTGTLMCNVNCKVRFDESGKDKMYNDAIITALGSASAPSNPSKPAATRNRRLWGTYYGVSLQVIVDDAIFRNNFLGVISGYNYNTVYKPDDSLIII
ncbi:Mtr2p Ecym_3235 [Eremothecium cymbalariae DBVPG|uniref:SnoaL-like domain-containing protein n=1 Tax=Eremothecium cymbalariae (strain CBS 270.75 / DBVPG 7215 / KCTC 17166 / NRRL Y-17582) TaxID=931890 RepID=G8JRG0_ERECY|nr:Hypothetical protein Ecym_3235 [Eremothecium cymbalariae DBVPG\